MDKEKKLEHIKLKNSWQNKTLIKHVSTNDSFTMSKKDKELRSALKEEIEEDIKSLAHNSTIKHLKKYISVRKRMIELKEDKNVGNDVIKDMYFREFTNPETNEPFESPGSIDRYYHLRGKNKKTAEKIIEIAASLSPNGVLAKSEIDWADDKVIFALDKFMERYFS